MDYLSLALSLAIFGFFFCCCGSCVIGSDAFGSDADPPTGWTEVSGSDWATTSGTLRTSTDNAVLKYNTPHPRSVASAYVACKLYGATSDELRILVNYTDSSNYHFVQFTIGDPNGCLALWRRVGGSNTLISKMRVAAAASTLHQLYVYFGGDTDLLFAATFGTDTIYHKEAAGFTGAYVGVATGTTAGEVRFDDFEFKRYKTTETDETSCPVYVPVCQLLSDTFTRSDDSDIGCSYDEAAGAWTIASNVLSTSSASAQAVIQVKHPFDRANVNLSANISGSASTDTIRLIVGRTGASDYYCAEWVFHSTSGSRTHKLRKCVAGTFTDLASENLTSLSVGATVAADVCFGGDKMSSGSLRAAVATPTVAGGPYDTAVGTGTLAGTATFDSLSLTQGGDLDDLDCAVCPVACCCGSDMGDAWIVDFGAGGWIDGSCNLCNEIQGEFELQYDAARSLSSGLCVFSYVVNDWCYDQEAIDNGCSTPTGGDWNVRLVITFQMTGETFNPNCLPNVRVSLGNRRSADDDTCYANSTAIYDGTFAKADYSNCQDPDLVPLAIPFSFRGLHNFNAGHTRICTGSLPTSVTVRPA